MILYLYIMKIIIKINKYLIEHLNLDNFNFPFLNFNLIFKRYQNYIGIFKKP